MTKVLVTIFTMLTLFSTINSFAAQELMHDIGQDFSCTYYLDYSSINKGEYTQTSTESYKAACKEAKSFCLQDKPSDHWYKCHIKNPVNPNPTYSCKSYLMFSSRRVGGKTVAIYTRKSVKNQDDACAKVLNACNEDAKKNERWFCIAP